MKKKEQKLAEKKILDYIMDARLRNPAFGFISAAISVMSVVFMLIAVRENRYKYLVPLGFLFLMFLLAFGGFLRSRLQANKAVKLIESDGLLEQTAAAIGSGNSEKLPGDTATFTDNYIIGRNTNSVLRHAEIIKVNPVIYKTGNGQTGYLAADTAEKTGINVLLFGDTNVEEAARQAIEMIKKYNPSVEVGEIVYK